VPTTLLAIDDSVTMRKVLENTFAGEDFRVVTADGVDAGLAKLRSEHPAIVLADVTLDGPGGYGLCGKIKAESPNTPVIVLASKQQPYDVAKGQASHADDFVEKPFDTQQLIDKVRRLLGKPVGAEVPAARPAAPAGPAMVGPPLAMPAAATPIAPAPASTRAPGGFAPGIAAKSPAGAVPPLNPRPTASGMGTGQTPATGAVAPGGRATLSYVSQPGQLPQAPGMQPASPRGAVQPPQAPLPPRQQQPLPAGRPPQPIHPAAAPAKPAAAAPASPAGAIAAATGSTGELAAKLAQMGLTEAQVVAILALSREVVEKVVWEVVPVLAETMIKEEIQRLTAE
jgi:CheY-like chemotaxis protein